MKFDYVWDKQNFRVHNEAKARKREVGRFVCGCVVEGQRMVSWAGALV